MGMLGAYKKVDGKIVESGRSADKNDVLSSFNREIINGRDSTSK